MIGNKVYRFAELPSTNEFAKSLIKKGADEWTIVIADKQTQGKGRLNKKWYSPTGGLWFSVILRPHNFLVLPLCVGVAVCEAMRELGVDANVKWPNDIIINGKKVAGILSEFEEGTVIVGVGINLNIREFPEEISNIATSLLLETGKVFDKERVFDRVMMKIKEKYNSLEVGVYPAGSGISASLQQEIITEFKALSITIGKRVKIETANRCLEGEALDIDADGALILKLPSGNVEKIYAGECSLQMGENFL